MKPPTDRRLEARRPASARAVVLAGSMELNAVIADESPSGLKLRLERPLALPRTLTVVDVAAGTAAAATLAWQKGIEVGLRRGALASLRGLIPSRLTSARDAWRRAGGR